MDQTNVVQISPAWAVLIILLNREWDIGIYIYCYIIAARHQFEPVQRPDIPEPP